MCGIAVLLSGSGSAEDHLPRVAAMVEAERHRGPDGSGVEVMSSHDPALVFGHVRLAIIDLSPAGRQPMRDPESGNWITFNGEIYNYVELRRELEGGGHRFVTATDTEVILKAYAEWGSECVRRLRGIFAFAIWQPGAGSEGAAAPRLFLARDHLGVKPLYYWRQGETLLFASEVRALLASGLVERRLSMTGLRSYLAYGSVQEPLTMIEGVLSLPPGHALSWQDGQIDMQRYWRLPPPEGISARPPARLLEEVGGRLSDAVRSQLVADVPLGVFLSGGIDSTAIAALAQRAAGGQVKTVSVVFDEKDYDERAYARRAAEHIGTDHVELNLTGGAVLETLPQALKAFDQPSVDGLNTYFVSKVTREAGLTVALSGVGGDEVFAGYGGYRKALTAERWGRRLAPIPGAARELTAGVVNALGARPVFAKMAELLRHPGHPYFLTRQLFTTPLVSELLMPECRDAQHAWGPPSLPQLAAETYGYDPVNKISALELQTYMLSTLLRDTDQMSMAHALEVRVPLVDHQLVEFLFTLPGGCKLDHPQPKPLLTRSLDGLLPDECVRRPKRGFELPFAVWLKGNLQTQVVERLFHPPSGSAFPFQAEGLKKLWRRFESGVLRWSHVWAVYVLLVWLDEHRVTT
jgi:asparagine synthase (glutamine-hydrolysing)